jgi:photosynthetic reaction center cytochrome c subunit
MVLTFKLATRRATAIAVVCLCALSAAHSQSTSATKPLMAEDAFKNSQVLRGTPVNEFMEEMGFFSAALTANCTTCHGADSSGSWDKYAVDTPMKQMARKMVVMMNTINQTFFAGKREVTCYSCHHGDDRPRVTPTIADVYSAAPAFEEPDALLPADPDEGSPDKILDKYIQALGGAQKLANLKSFAAKGTSEGYAEDKYPVEIFAKAPDQRAVFTHAESGERITNFDGSSGWALYSRDDKPVPLLPLLGDDLEGAKLDAILAFPGQLKQSLTQWRVSLPETVNGKDVDVVQATANGRTPINFYFDQKTGLLVRMVRYSDTKIGLYSTQTDYSDYRDVAGVKMPFHIQVAWLDGRSDIILTQIQPNVPIDPSRFSKPAEPPSPKAANQ